MQGPKKEGSLRRPKLAVVPHLSVFHKLKKVSEKKCMTGCMSGPKKEGSLRRPKLAVVSHLFIFHSFKVKLKITKKREIHDRMHARPQKGGVPEKAEIGRSITHFYFS